MNMIHRCFFYLGTLFFIYFIFINHSFSVPEIADVLTDICSNKSCNSRQIEVISNYVGLVKDIPHLYSKIETIKSILKERNILREYTDNVIDHINGNKFLDGCGSNTFSELYILLNHLTNRDPDFTFRQCLRALERVMFENIKLINKHCSVEFFYISVIPRLMVPRRSNFSFLFRGFPF
ncbi:MAG: hypothetical protein C0440_04835 [Candidatus Pelagibacter sp.]|nr:hypothetical protein [Candidatus Pelagibacter sp.]